MFEPACELLGTSTYTAAGVVVLSTTLTSLVLTWRKWEDRVAAIFSWILPMLLAFALHFAGCGLLGSYTFPQAIVAGAIIAMAANGLFKLPPTKLALNLTPLTRQPSVKEYADARRGA